MPYFIYIVFLIGYFYGVFIPLTYTLIIISIHLLMHETGFIEYLWKKWDKVGT